MIFFALPFEPERHFDSIHLICQRKYSATVIIGCVTWCYFSDAICEVTEQLICCKVFEFFSMLQHLLICIIMYSVYTICSKIWCLTEMWKDISLFQIFNSDLTFRKYNRCAYLCVCIVSVIRCSVRVSVSVMRNEWETTRTRKFAHTFAVLIAYWSNRVHTIRTPMYVSHCH